VLGRWISVIHDTPAVLESVLGGIQLEIRPVMREFLQSRLDLPREARAPTRLAAAAGVIQAARIHWFFGGGDLATAVAEGLGLLERGFGSDPRTWEALSRRARRRAPARTHRARSRPAGRTAGS
jgi:TetR/AcrR family transcriptional regulator, regulator of mycofactocin system